MRYLFIAFVIFEIAMAVFYATRATTDGGGSFLSRRGYLMDDMELSPAGTWNEDEDLTERELLLRGVESRSATFMELNEME